MTATQIGSEILPDHRVGDRVQVQHRGQAKPERISSIHRVNDGVEYVVHADPADPSGGGMGEVLNVWTSSGTSSFQTALGGAS
jgi:hypothetical protein